MWGIFHLSGGILAGNYTKTSPPKNQSPYSFFLCGLESSSNGASRGDLAAQETVQEVSRVLANAIQFLALAYDPQRIVLGGGVATSTPLFFENLMQAIKQLSQESWVSRHLITPNFITVTPLGPNIGILGAAALVP